MSKDLCIKKVAGEYARRRTEELLQSDTYTTAQLIAEIMLELHPQVSTAVQKTIEHGLATGHISLTDTMRLRIDQK